MPVKVTLEMIQERRAWSEAHYYLGSQNIQTAAAPAAILAQKRAALLGANAQLLGFRISYVPADRIVDRTSMGLGFTGMWPADPTGILYDSEFANVALLVNLSNPSFPIKSLYMAGVPRSQVLVAKTPGDYQITSAFETVATVYLKELTGNGADTSNWGYRVRASGDQRQAVGIVSNALSPAQVGIQSPQLAFIPAPARPVQAGDKVWLTGWRRRDSHQPGLQGAYTVASVLAPTAPSTTYTYFLYNTSAVSITQFQAPGIIAPLEFSYAPYLFYELNKVVTRKRGGSLGAPRGRSRIKF